MNPLLTAIRQQLMGKVYLDPVTAEPIWGDVLVTLKAGRITLVRATQQYTEATLPSTGADTTPPA